MIHLATLYIKKKKTMKIDFKLKKKKNRASLQKALFTILPKASDGIETALIITKNLPIKLL